MENLRERVVRVLLEFEAMTEAAKEGSSVSSGDYTEYANRVVEAVGNGTQFNGLSPAEHERLAILSEELGEAQQAIGKILRHGYESSNPDVAPKNRVSNRVMLEKELGDVAFAIAFLGEASDVSRAMIWQYADEKRERIKPYLHHQENS